MTKEEALAAIKKYGSQRKASVALGVSRTTLRRLTEGSSVVAPDIQVSSATGGFTLAGKHLLATKPTDVWKARFFALRKGMGYTLERLSEEWGKSVETIKENAKRFGSLRYVEDSERPGEYIACAVHPETPKGR